jgi:hypothetical protein
MTGLAFSCLSKIAHKGISGRGGQVERLNRESFSLPCVNQIKRVRSGLKAQEDQIPGHI